MSASTRKPLPVDLVDLCIALEAEAGGLRWFFDTQTGDTILLNAEYEPENHGGVTPQEIEADPVRFRPVPAADASRAAADMQRFVEGLSDGRLKESLQMALQAPRPEKRFRAALGWIPEELERWHRFRQQLHTERARAWLAELGIDPLPVEDVQG